jgi:hypothetical protein
LARFLRKNGRENGKSTANKEQFALNAIRFVRGVQYEVGDFVLDGAAA